MGAHLVRVNARLVRASGMVLIRWLHIDGRFGGHQRVVLADKRVTVRPEIVPGLDRVEVQPVRLVKPHGRGSAPLPVVANQVAAATAVLQPLGHGYPDRFVFSRS